MRGEHDDRRIIYTKNALRGALIALLADKHISKVTVTDICQLANINRSTFYAHYGNPGDLLGCMERELIEDIMKFVESYKFADDAPSSRLKIVSVFKYIQDNAALCRTLLGPHGDTAVQGEIMALMEKAHIEEWRASRAIDPETMEYILLYTIRGSIGVVQGWIENGLKKPAEEIADMLISAINRGLSAFD